MSNNLPQKAIRRTSATTPQVRNKSISRSTVFAARYYKRQSGPVPDPETIRGYEEICPGAADRIIKMAENQAAHRQQLEKDIYNNRFTLGKRGQNCAVLVTITAFITSAYCAYLGESVVAITIGGAGLASLVAVFITGRKHDSGGIKAIEKDTQD